MGNIVACQHYDGKYAAVEELPSSSQDGSQNGWKLSYLGYEDGREWEGSPWRPVWIGERAYFSGLTCQTPYTVQDWFESIHSWLVEDSAQPETSVV
jgi:hypothetical protein